MFTLDFQHFQVLVEIKDHGGGGGVVVVVVVRVFQSSRYGKVIQGEVHIS